MSIEILLCTHPHRSIALRTSTHVLVLRHSSSSTENGQFTAPPSTKTSSETARCIVDFSTREAVDLSDYRPLSPLAGEGTLGLITIDHAIFLCVVAGSTNVATARPGETVQRIDAVDFYCLTSSEYDPYSSHDVGFDTPDALSLDGADNDYSHDRRENALEHPCQELKKLLSGGSFYYSGNFDVTSRLQDRSTYNATFDYDDADDQFLWNSYMIKPLLDFRARLATHEQNALDTTRILTLAIRGFALSIIIPPMSSPVRPASSGSPSVLTVISRLSCRRAGTRFNARGIDDEGNVANFVETETLFCTPSGLCFSYVQIRGSVPVFWEQAPGLIPGQQKIQVIRSAEATQPAFDKHFDELERKYGAVHVVNLLSETKTGEMDLTNRYRYHVRHSPLNGDSEAGTDETRLLRETEFDFHAQTRGPTGYVAAEIIKPQLQDSAEQFAYFLCELAGPARSTSVKTKVQDGHPKMMVILQQEGIFRTNCLDCLDRTNIIQTLISRTALEAFLDHCHSSAESDFWIRHSSLWADNGDNLSKIYAGTGALKTSFTRHGKMSLAGAIADARKSATRMYMNNFADKGRQNTMDVLLGRLLGQMPVHLYDPINDFVSLELNKRAAEYSSPKTIRIWVGTFNLNGRLTGINEDLSPWLCPDVDAKTQPDIVVIGFQEIVELSPQHIMSTDPSIRQMWEKAVKATLDRHAKKFGTEEYVLLRSGQLVGAALMVFVKAAELKNIRNVEGSLKKTGMSGMAGNKGAVAIRMDYADTRICFVTAHLAAGFANYHERNQNYNTIVHGLRFQRNCSIEDHDAIIWLGDFNYRIGLNDENVRKLIQMGDLETLYENDQLNLQMVAGLTFPFYSEARITFLPTYRYDVGVDVYDTSEKHRIPAWCDRVLWKGKNLRNISYNTCPLRFSDHRPVYANFTSTVNVINETIKDRLSRELYNQRRRDVGSSSTHNLLEVVDDEEDLIGYDPIEEGLPPASSDRRKWWLDNGLPARSTIEPPHPRRNFIPNPHRPSNPFTPTDETDWIKNSNSNSSSYPDPNSDSDGMKNPLRTQSTRRRAPEPPPARRSRAATDLRHSNIDDDDGGGGGGVGGATTSPPRPGPSMTTVGLRAAGTGNVGTSNISTTGLISPLSTSFPSPPLSKSMTFPAPSTPIRGKFDGGGDHDLRLSIRSRRDGGGEGEVIKRKPAPPSIPKKPAVLRSPTGTSSTTSNTRTPTRTPTRISAGGGSGGGGGTDLGNRPNGERKSSSIRGSKGFNYDGVDDDDDGDGHGREVDVRDRDRDRGGKNRDYRGRKGEGEGEGEGLVDQHPHDDLKKLNGRWESLL